VLLLLWGVVQADAATFKVYGLESVRFNNVLDPGERPERLRIVSGGLKLTGRNRWEMVTYIPRRTAAPRSDHGVYRIVGNRIFLYSFLSFSTYTGTVDNANGRLSISKINASGQAQHEVWYIVQP